jgi:signal transduction histidine kinase
MVAIMAQRPNPDRQVLARAAAIVRGTAGRMARWTDELRDASRLQVGEPLPLDVARVDVVGLVRALAEEHQRLAPTHRIVVSALHEEIVGRWDRGRVERVVHNLLGNAVKYSPDGGDVAVEVAEDDGHAVLRVRDQGIGIPADDLPQLVENLIENAVKYSPEGGHIAIRLEREGERAHLSVADQGIGIPADDLPHLFGLYRRGANTADRLPGSGIGLAVVKAAVERHGGTVEVESAPGAGSTFTVRLPVGRDD